MGKNFIEKLFYFLERPPPTMEHEWEHHMVSLGSDFNRRGTDKEGKGTRGNRTSSSTANRSSSSVQHRDTSTNRTRTAPVGGGGGATTAIGGGGGGATTAVGRRMGRKPPVM